MSQLIEGLTKNGPHLVCGLSGLALPFNLGQTGIDAGQRPTEGNTQAMGADDQGILRPILSIARGPDSSGQESVAALPEKDVLELREPSGAIQSFPFAGVYLASDAIHVEDLLRQQEAFRLESDIVDMVVPSGMLAKGAKPDLRFWAAAEKSLSLA